MKLVTLAALLLAALQCACEHAPSEAKPEGANSVAAFLEGAERQSETDEQRKDIQRALRDMLEKPPAQLRELKYPDYAGKQNSWTVTQLLEHYFVPGNPMMIDTAHFFDDLRAPKARAAIQHQLDEVTRALPDR